MKQTSTLIVGDIWTRPSICETLKLDNLRITKNSCVYSPPYNEQELYARTLQICMVVVLSIGYRTHLQIRQIRT